MKRTDGLAITLIALLVAAGCTVAKDTVVVTERAERQPVASTEPAVVDTSEVDPAPSLGISNGRFDGGKMWTFDHPPTEYFTEAYAFAPDSQWFAKARLGMLRFSTYCSASFVSPAGLVLTNHHCGRESISSVSKKDEALLDNGFYAESEEDERRVEDLFVDQLMSIEDVSAKVYEAGTDVRGADARNKARQAFAEVLEKQLTTTAKLADTTLTVEVIGLYSGGQYSAYTFKRYHDVRLVMAPELSIGFFGGDPDNFTFPRYNLDMSLFRVYENGEPFRPEVHFAWSEDGASVGDPVFVIGNPGTTSRLSTVSQLIFERDNNLPQQLAVLKSRAGIMKAFVDEYPERADELDLRNTYFSILNTIKASEGQLAGLQDVSLIARRQKSEDVLRQSIINSDSLSALYKNIFRDLAEMQRSKEAVSDQSAAFTFFSTELLTSHVLLRALYGYVHDILKQRGAPQDQLDELVTDAREIADWPVSVEKEYIEARLLELRNGLGPAHPTMTALFRKTTPAQLADSIASNTAIADSASFDSLLLNGYLQSKDVTVSLIQSIAPLFFSLGQQLSSFEEKEESLNAALGRAQFAVYGHSVPPDASFSPRISDGVVAGYEYNGTRAPAFSTFYGLYDRANSYEAREEWELPESWTTPPADFDMSIPMNLVSTNDITGGNSGSPLLNTDLQIVGLAFDSNIEALPNEYLFLDEAGRAISVDSRGMLHALDKIYDATRIVAELRNGRN
ncbi:MAG: S46 family peptidase [Rhodothermales bacterium]|nr:S46 family peptidase [Rhodothermales bacterium]